MAAKSQKKPDKPGAQGTCAFVSLGCPKNLVDSERMLHLLQQDGFRLTGDPADADFVVVNTCGFVQIARDESYAAIDEMLELKRTGRLRGVIVAGCLAERNREALLEAGPEIDGLVGVFGRDEIARVAGCLQDGSAGRPAVFCTAPSQPADEADRLRVTPRHLAYLKISEGCDRLCTFCAIPKIRGPHVTKPIEQVVDEARRLADDGVRELVLIAQDTTYYGVDLYGRARLADLLERLSEIDSIRWLRLLYLYPLHIDDELIAAVAGIEKIVPYLDVPLQHVNDTMLRRMKRGITRSETEDLIQRLRAGIPDLALRTTLIAGFPGETDEMADELVEFMQRVRFERLGVFTYSLEPDTPAANLPDHVPQNIKAARRDRLMAAQQEIAFESNAAWIGRRLDVIIDAAVPDQADAWIGRTAADAPDIDTVVYVTGENLAAGRFVRCEIVACRDYDLIGAAVGDAW